MMGLSSYFILLSTTVEADLLDQIVRTFHISWGAFLSQLISFLLVAFLLRLYAFKPVLAILEKRRLRIIEGEEKLKRAEDKLEKVGAESEEILATANGDAERLIEEAKDSVKQLTEQKIKEALQMADQLIQRSQAMADVEKEKAFRELRKEFATLLATCVKTLIGRELSPNDLQRLNTESLSFLNQDKPRQSS